MTEKRRHNICLQHYRNSNKCMPLLYDKESICVTRSKLSWKMRKIIVSYLIKRGKNHICYIIMISLHKYTNTYTKMYTQTPYTQI